MIEFSQQLIDNEWMVPLHLEILEGKYVSNGKPFFGVRTNAWNTSQQKTVIVKRIYPCRVDGVDSFVMARPQFNEESSIPLSLQDNGIYLSRPVSPHAKGVQATFYRMHKNDPLISGKLTTRTIYLSYVRGFGQCTDANRAGFVKRFAKREGNSKNIEYARECESSHTGLTMIEMLQGFAPRNPDHDETNVIGY